MSFTLRNTMRGSYPDDRIVESIAKITGLIDRYCSGGAVATAFSNAAAILAAGGSRRMSRFVAYRDCRSRPRARRRRSFSIESLSEGRTFLRFGGGRRNEPLGWSWVVLMVMAGTFEPEPASRKCFEAAARVGEEKKGRCSGWRTLGEAGAGPKARMGPGMRL